jgi:uncharacterized protein YjiS (DUF1127 family)
VKAPDGTNSLRLLRIGASSTGQEGSVIPGIPWRSRSHTPLGLTSVARRAVSAFRRWWSGTRNRAALTALDDRTLEDIGLTRMVAVYEVDKETLTERSAPIGSGQLIRLRRVANPDNEA